MKTGHEKTLTERERKTVRVFRSGVMLLIRSEKEISNSLREQSIRVIVRKEDQHRGRDPSYQCQHHRNDQLSEPVKIQQASHQYFQ